MSDAILVPNAGVGGPPALRSPSSSSANATHSRRRSAATSKLYGRARFRAKDAQGNIADEHAWSEVSRRNMPARLISCSTGWCATRVTRMLLQIGHRVVHGGAVYAAPVLVDAAGHAILTEFLHWRRYISHTTCCRFALLPNGRASCRRWRRNSAKTSPTTSAISC